jgi:hypothetical protein
MSKVCLLVLSSPQSFLKLWHMCKVMFPAAAVAAAAAVG